MKKNRKIKKNWIMTAVTTFGAVTAGMIMAGKASADTPNSADQDFLIALRNDDCNPDFSKWHATAPDDIVRAFRLEDTTIHCGYTLDHIADALIINEQLNPALKEIIVKNLAYAFGINLRSGDELKFMIGQHFAIDAKGNIVTFTADGRIRQHLKINLLNNAPQNLLPTNHKFQVLGSIYLKQSVNTPRFAEQVKKKTSDKITKKLQEKEGLNYQKARQKAQKAVGQLTRNPRSYQILNQGIKQAQNHIINDEQNEVQNDLNQTAEQIVHSLDLPNNDRYSRLEMPTVQTSLPKTKTRHNSSQQNQEDQDFKHQINLKETKPNKAETKSDKIATRHSKEAQDDQHRPSAKNVATVTQRVTAPARTISKNPDTTPANTSETHNNDVHDDPRPQQQVEQGVRDANAEREANPAELGVNQSPDCSEDAPHDPIDHSQRPADSLADQPEEATNSADDSRQTVVPVTLTLAELIQAVTEAPFDRVYDQFKELALEPEQAIQLLQQIIAGVPSNQWDQNRALPIIIGLSQEIDQADGYSATILKNVKNFNKQLLTVVFLKLDAPKAANLINLIYESNDHTAGFDQEKNIVVEALLDLYYNEQPEIFEKIIFKLFEKNQELATKIFDQKIKRAPHFSEITIKKSGKPSYLTIEFLSVGFKFEIERGATLADLLRKIQNLAQDDQGFGERIKQCLQVLADQVNLGNLYFSITERNDYQPREADFNANLDYLLRFELNPEKRLDLLGRNRINLSDYLPFISAI